MHALVFLHDLPGVLVHDMFMAVAGGLAGLTCVRLALGVGTPQAKELLDRTMRTSGVVTAALTRILAFCEVQARSQMADLERLVHAELPAIAFVSPMKQPSRDELTVSAARFGVLEHALAHRAGPMRPAQHAIHGAR